MPRPIEVSAPLRLAVDAHNLAHDWRGIGRYLRAILRRYVNRSDVTLALVVKDPLPMLLRRQLEQMIGGRVERVVRRVPRSSDVFWSPWNGTFFDAAIPNVVTMHDAVPFVYPAADERRRASEQEPFRRSATVAVRVVANSRFTAREVERELHLDPARVRVTLLGVEAAFTPVGVRATPTERARPYVLYVGAIEPRKNVETLVAAHARAFPNGEVALVCVGASPPAAPQNVDLVTLGPSEPHEVAALYRGALATAIPSLYEGFGFPLLESMACGTPGIATRGSSLDEVGGDAAYYVDDGTSADAWTAALRTVANDGALRADLRERGLRRARTFSWDRCAEETLTILREAAGR